MAQNLALEDATLRHAVMLERLKAGEAESFTEFLREIDRNLREILTRDGLTAFQRQRTEAMLAEVDSMIASVLLRFSGQFTIDLRTMAALEGVAAAGVLSTAGFAASIPTAAQLWAAASTAPLAAGNGRLLAPFIASWSQSERDRVTGAIRLAVAEGRTVAQTVQVIRGTRAANYADGILAVTSRNAQAIVMTAVAHVGSVARAETYAANDDILAGEQVSSTLDHRTCKTCAALDGRVFKLRQGPMTPFHVRCRCVRIPVLKTEWRALTAGEQRSSDAGPVDATTNYFDWLKRQDAAYIDSVIGPTRGKLLRDGGLTSQRFAELQLDRRWTPLTLEQMRKLDPDAFKRAGI